MTTEPNIGAANILARIKSAHSFITDSKLRVEEFSVLELLDCVQNIDFAECRDVLSAQSCCTNKLPTESRGGGDLHSLVQIVCE